MATDIGPRDIVILAGGGLTDEEAEWLGEGARAARLTVRDVVQNVETAKVECHGGAAFVVGPVRDGDER